jgi:uncharacterized protein YcfL
MKRLLLVFCASLIFTGCGSKPDKPTIEIKLDGQQIPFETKSTWITAQNAIYGGSVSGEQRHALRWITIRNYEYDVKGALAANDGKLTSPEQVKLFLSLHDDPGTNDKSPIRVSTFEGAKRGPMEFEFINLTIFKDGKEESYRVSPSGQANRQDSQVKILSVTDDTVTGEVTAKVKVDNKELTIKGPFTAKIFKP